MYNTKVLPDISADEHHDGYVKCDVAQIRNKQVLMEIKLYSKTDWEGLKDRMCATKDSFMASYSVDTQIDSMRNDLMTELESALDECTPKKIARPKDRVPWITN